jgi:hypothetical protein
MESLKRFENALYFFGYITFEGPDGVTRESAFFRVYQAALDKFDSTDDPDYEHH